MVGADYDQSYTTILIVGYTANNFAWDSYLSVTGSEAAPDTIFVGRAKASVGADSSVHGWKTGEYRKIVSLFIFFLILYKGMKLEAADTNDPEMIYVATVANVMEVNIEDTKKFYVTL